MAESGYQNREQSELKHHALRLYLEAATLILGSRWDLRYVDCCAGPWMSTQPDPKDTSFGIALDVLRSTRYRLKARGLAPKINCLFIEKERQAYHALETFTEAQTSEDICLEARNWNFAEHISEIVQFCRGPKYFPFIFIDPWGWKLAGISQISPLLKLRPGEVVINLMSSFITRFVHDDATDLRDLLGESATELRRLEGSELEFAVVRKYCELVKKEGAYPYVCALPVMKPESDAFNFYLIYATRNIKGVQVFKDVEKRTEQLTHVIRAGLQQQQRMALSGNAELFGPSIQYRERKYQELSDDNKRRARMQVLELLKSRRHIRYEDCYGEALQLSAVYEINLRDWISEWERKRVVTVNGRKRPTEVLKVGGGHTLTYDGSS